MQEIKNAKQESSARSIAVKRRGSNRVTIAERILINAFSESERICAKQILFKMTGRCEA